MTLTTHALAAVLEASPKPFCSALFLTEGSLSSYSLFQVNFVDFLFESIVVISVKGDLMCIPQLF